MPPGSGGGAGCERPVGQADDEAVALLRAAHPDEVGVDDGGAVAEAHRRRARQAVEHGDRGAHPAEGVGAVGSGVELQLHGVGGRVVRARRGRRRARRNGQRGDGGGRGEQAGGAGHGSLLGSGGARGFRQERRSSRRDRPRARYCPGRSPGARPRSNPRPAAAPGPRHRIGHRVSAHPLRGKRALGWQRRDVPVDTGAGGKRRTSLARGVARPGQAGRLPLPRLARRLSWHPSAVPRLVDHRALHDAARAIVVAAGSEEAEAELVAAHLVGADLRGHGSHGVARLPGTSRRSRAGCSCRTRRRACSATRARSCASRATAATASAWATRRWSSPSVARAGRALLPDARGRPPSRPAGDLRRAGRGGRHGPRRVRQRHRP